MAHPLTVLLVRAEERGHVVGTLLQSDLAHGRHLAGPQRHVHPGLQLGLAHRQELLNISPDLDTSSTVLYCTVLYCTVLYWKWQEYLHRLARGDGELDAVR